MEPIGIFANKLSRSDVVNFCNTNAVDVLPPTNERSLVSEYDDEMENSEFSAEFAIVDVRETSEYSATDVLSE